VNSSRVRSYRRPVPLDAGLNITLTLTYCYSLKVRWAAYLGNVGLSVFPFARAFVIGFAWAVNVAWHGAAEPQ
jgi:hypothetical protein